MSLATTGVARTMCPMNCHPTLCGMLAEVRDGQLVGVKGDPANPDSRGFLCIRGQASREIISNPARLLHPLLKEAVKKGGKPASRATRCTCCRTIRSAVGKAPRVLGSEARRGPAPRRLRRRETTACAAPCTCADQ